MSRRPTLEEALKAAGAIDDDGLAKARGAAQQRGVPLEKAIVALGVVGEDVVWRALSKVHGLPFVDPGKAKLTPEVTGRIPNDQIEQNDALPVIGKDGVLFVAIDDPLKTWVADNFAFFAGSEVRCALAPPGALKAAIKKVLGSKMIGVIVSSVENRQTLVRDS